MKNIFSQVSNKASEYTTVTMEKAKEAVQAVNEFAESETAQGMKKAANTATRTVKEISESDAAKAIGNAAKNTAVEAVKSDFVKQVAAGAATGAVVGSVVPFFGTVTGATVGVAMGTYKAFIKM
ncbi:MAG: hypothetical protein ABGX41_04370 [Pseudohongiella sp.]